MTPRNSEDLAEERQLMNAAEMQSTLERMAREILEKCPDPKKILLVGIRTGGVFLAERLRTLLGDQAAIGAIDITLYRDDVFVGLPRPEVGSTDIPCSLEGNTVVLVDDVLYTGRTVRSALVELMDFGRPEKVQLAVLIDRGHRELPIQPDYTGLKIETSREQSVQVFFHEQNKTDRVVLLKLKPTGANYK